MSWTRFYGPTNDKHCVVTNPRIDKESCLVDPTSFPGRIGHHFPGNSPAVILGHHKTRRDRGVLDRLQQPVEFFSIHGVLLSAQLTVRLSLIGIVHIRLLYPVSLRECDQL